MFQKTHRLTICPLTLYAYLFTGTRKHDCLTSKLVLNKRTVCREENNGFNSVFVSVYDQ